MGIETVNALDDSLNPIDGSKRWLDFRAQRLAETCVKAFAEDEGLIVEKTTQNNDLVGRDVELMVPKYWGHDERLERWKVDVQAKSVRRTSSNFGEIGGRYHYDLPANDYRRLCRTSMQDVPLLLALVVMPPGSEWVMRREQEVALTCEPFLIDLRNEESNTHSNTTRVFFGIDERLARGALTSFILEEFRKLCDV